MNPGTRIGFPRELRITAAVLAGIVVILGGAGVAHVRAPAHWRHFDLDAEMTVPAAYSALLLLAAAAAALSAARLVGRRSLFGLSALFLFMGGDEAFSFHERLEGLTGVDWELLYLPIVLVGGVGWLLTARLLRGSPALWTWLGGAAAWAVSQTLEFAQYDAADQPVRHYNAMMVPEELLEMTGSALWLLTLLALLLARRPARRAAEQPGHAHPADRPQHPAAEQRAGSRQHAGLVDSGDGSRRDEPS